MQNVTWIITLPEGVLYVDKDDPYLERFVPDIKQVLPHMIAFE